MHKGKSETYPTPILLSRYREAIATFEDIPERSGIHTASTEQILVAVGVIWSGTSVITRAIPSPWIVRSAEKESFS